MINFSFAGPQIHDDGSDAVTSGELAGVDYSVEAFASDNSRDAALGWVGDGLQFVALEGHWVAAAGGQLSQMHIGPAFGSKDFATVAYPILKAKLEDYRLDKALDFSIVIARREYIVTGDISGPSIAIDNPYNLPDHHDLIMRTANWLCGFVAGAALAQFR